MSDLSLVRLWAAELIREHLDPVFGEGSWTFGFDRAKRRAGLCNYTDHRITVSRYLAAEFDDDTNRQTLLHEIAHALAGPDAGHGPKWKVVAESLGYVGGRTFKGDPVSHELAPWVGSCPGEHQHYRYRRPTRVASCAKCARGFSPRHLIVWQRRDELRG